LGCALGLGGVLALGFFWFVGGWGLLFWVKNDEVGEVGK
jgi:hypothetical protein